MVTAPPWNRASRVALLGGVFSSLITLVLFVVVFPTYDYSRTSAWGLLWYTVGTFLLAAISVFSFVRYRIVLPVVVTAGLYIVALVSTWNRITSAYEEGATLHAGPTALAFLLMFWVIPFALIALIGGSEYLLERLFRRYWIRGSDL